MTLALAFLAPAAVAGYALAGAAERWYDGTRRSLVMAWALGIGGALVLVWVMGRALVASGTLRKGGAFVVLAASIERVALVVLATTREVTLALVGPLLRFLGVG